LSAFWRLIDIEVEDWRHALHEDVEVQRLEGMETRCKRDDVEELRYGE